MGTHRASGLVSQWSANELYPQPLTIHHCRFIRELEVWRSQLFLLRHNVHAGKHKYWCPSQQIFIYVYTQQCAGKYVTGRQWEKSSEGNFCPFL